MHPLLDNHLVNHIVKKDLFIMCTVVSTHLAAATLLVMYIIHDDKALLLTYCYVMSRYGSSSRLLVP